MAKLTLHGSYKVGNRVKRGQDVFEILEIISTQDKYELDGVTYSNYPGEEPDLEWVETLAEVRQLDQSEINRLAEAKSVALAAREEASQIKSAEVKQRRAEKETQFNRFLEGEFSENIWSGYDLPAALYSSINMSVSPIKTNPDRYQAQYVGNGLGYVCQTTADLEALFQYIYDVSDPKPSIERVERSAKYCDSSVYQGYLAGAEYYRWLLARGIVS